VFLKCLLPESQRNSNAWSKTAKQDPDFRKELIVEATNAFLDGDIDTGKKD